eukprot:3584382-Amphidinium_carterae.1
MSRPSRSNQKSVPKPSCRCARLLQLARACVLGKAKLTEEKFATHTRKHSSEHSEVYVWVWSRLDMCSAARVQDSLIVIYRKSSPLTRRQKSARKPSKCSKACAVMLMVGFYELVSSVC